MKKSIIVIIFLLALTICTSCAMSKNIIRSGSGDLVIECTIKGLFTDEYNNKTNFIRLYDDKTISTGTNDKIDNKYDVNPDDYQKIINYAFSPDFINLKEDLSDKRVADGSIQYITIYFEDGSSKKIGGANPSNRKFQKLYKMLNEVVEKGEEE